MQQLKEKKIAVLVENGFEQVELTSPVDALKQNGATVDIVSPVEGRVRGWNKNNWGDDFAVDRNVRDVRPEEYDALLLPGGVINPDKLRRHEGAVGFVRDFMATGKPVAAICHGPQVMIEADAVKGRKMTSFASIATDLKNAGANWVDEEVVVDAGLVTSRSPADLQAFNTKLVEEIVEGRHERELMPA